MINNLSIKNFKCHQKTELDFKPLTILTGINSYGKSSVIQVLLLLRQTYQKKLLNEGLDLNMPLVAIGVTEDALYRHSVEPYISFSIRYENINEDTFIFAAENNLTDSFVPLKEHKKKSEGNLFDQQLFNNGFQYISALRIGAQSNYGKDSYSVKSLHQISSQMGKGELLGNFLYEFQNELTHNYIDNSDDIPLIEQVIYWEQKITPNVSIRVEQTSDNTGYAIKYGYEKNGVKPLQNLRAENIGLGVSYTLPVIVAILSAKKGDLIIIENPEAHLHPDAQLEIGNLICRAAQYGVQIIIETHSDHIVNSVQIACKQFHDTNGEKGISKENIAVHYFGTRNEPFAATSQSIKIKDDGSIDYQPKGFFDTIEKSLNQLY